MAKHNRRGRVFHDSNCGSVIGVISGKGGVGKTTTSANIGLILVTEFDKRVLLIDGNITNSNLGLYLGYLCPPVTLNDILKRLLPPEKAVYVHKSGLHIIPASLGIDSKITYLMFKQAVNRLVKSGEYDFIIVDAAAGVGPEVKATLNVCSDVLVVTVPELPTVTSAVRVTELARKMKKNVLGVVVNRVRGKPYEVLTQEIEDNCGAPVLGVVPDDDNIPESVSLREPLVLYAPNAPSSREFRGVSRQLIELCSGISGEEASQTDAAVVESTEPATKAVTPPSKLSALQLVQRDSGMTSRKPVPVSSSAAKSEVAKELARERDLTKAESTVLLPLTDSSGKTPGMKVMGWILERFGKEQTPSSQQSTAGTSEHKGSATATKVASIPVAGTDNDDAATPNTTTNNVRRKKKEGKRKTVARRR